MGLNFLFMLFIILFVYVCSQTQGHLGTVIFILRLLNTDSFYTATQLYTYAITNVFFFFFFSENEDIKTWNNPILCFKTKS